MRRAAEERGVAIEIRTFTGTTRTAIDAAKRIGCGLGQIIKSLVFVTDRGEPVLALCSGPDRVDEARLAARVGAGSVRRASADEALAATGFPIGGVPPFGHATALRVVIDPGLLAFEELWAGAGTGEAVVGIRSADLARASGGEVAPIRA